jgi:hypothetical protein
MTDRRDMNINIERDPAPTIYTDGGNSGGLIAALVIVVLALAALAFVFLRPGGWPGAGDTNVTIEQPAVPNPPADSPALPAPEAPALETPAPATPAPAEPAPTPAQ